MEKRNENKPDRLYGILLLLFLSLLAFAWIWHPPARSFSSRVLSTTRPNENRNDEENKPENERNEVTSISFASRR